MKHLIKTFALLLSLILFSFAPSKRSTFTSEDGLVSITFPTDFTTDKNSNENVNRTKAQGALNDQLFVIGYAQHLNKMVEHEEMADVSLKSFVETLGAEVTKQEVWEYKKNKGIHAWLKGDNNELVGEYKVILIGQNQFQLISVAEPSKWDEKAAAKFFKSFKLAKEAL